MKRILRCAAILVLTGMVIALGSGCKGAKGEAYVGYSWVSSPLYLYDENPSVPSTVINGEYYKTEEGEYYMEYTAWDDSDWWMVYAITANEGKAFYREGDPAYFEITLYSYGPTVYQWSESRSAGTPAGEGQTDSPSAVTEIGEPEPYEGRTDHGTETIVRGGYTLRIEYGRVPEGEQ